MLGSVTNSLAHVVNRALIGTASSIIEIYLAIIGSKYHVKGKTR